MYLFKCQSSPYSFCSFRSLCSFPVYFWQQEKQCSIESETTASHTHFKIIVVYMVFSNRDEMTFQTIWIARLSFIPVWVRNRIFHVNTTRHRLELRSGWNFKPIWVFRDEFTFIFSIHDSTRKSTKLLRFFRRTQFHSNSPYCSKYYEFANSWTYFDALGKTNSIGKNYRI